MIEIINHKSEYVLDTHTHTTVSGHAYNTINEMINSAYQKGLELLCITEHGPAMPAAPHQYYFNNIRVLNEHLDQYPIQVLFGMEANILDNTGKTDYDGLCCRDDELKIVIASCHSCCISNENSYEYITDAYVNAMKKPYVSILGHIDDGKFACDYDRIIRAAIENNVLIELNNSSNGNNSFRLNSNENSIEYLKLCKKHGAMISLGSDAHCEFDIANYGNIQKLLDEVNFPKELIINTSTEKFIDFLKLKRKNIY